MKTRFSLVWLISAGLLLAACNGNRTSKAGNPPPNEEPESSIQTVGTGCFSSIPLMAGSQEDAKRQINTDELILSMGGKVNWFPGERKVYSNSKSTDAVLEYFSSVMPQNGWEESSNIPGKNWGFIRWKKEGFETQLLTGQFEKTIYILGCLQFDPTPTPIPVAALTMKGSFDLLKKVSNLDDLAFYGYEAFHIKEDGLAIHYMISGFSKTTQQFCSLQADEPEVELNCFVEEPPDEPLVEDMDTLKDSPELVQEAFQKYAPCPNGAGLSINLIQAEAQFICSEEMWSGDVSPYK
jgi:hypothetical protein